MKTAQRPLWTEGMLLSPQHFQALDRFYESALAARVEAVAAVDWGVLAVEIDPGALASGQVRLVRFAGVMPGGLPLVVDGPEGAPPARAVAELFAATTRSLDVWLAVPRERDTVANWAEEGSVGTSRFLASTRSLVDAGAPGAAVPVRLVRPNALLLLGDEPRDDYEALKLAEIVRMPSGQFQIADSYVPPCLRIGASPRLLAGLREVLARAMAKQRELSDLRRNREGANEIAAPDLIRLLQLLVINAHAPVLAQLADVGDATPYDCYLALARLQGQLCTFRGDDPTAIPKFQHIDLRGSFDPLFLRLSEQLGGMAAQTYVTVPLEQRAGGLYLARLQEERILRGQFFLTVQCDHPESMVGEQLPRLAKIASAADINGLVQAATAGLPLQLVHRPPPQLPVRPGTLYFALGTGDRYWQGVVTGRNLAIYLPPPFDPARTKLELLVIPEASGVSAQPPRTPALF